VDTGVELASHEENVGALEFIGTRMEETARLKHDLNYLAHHHLGVGSPFHGVVLFPLLLFLFRFLDAVLHDGDVPNVFSPERRQ
jgi:hypothetical protein